jgi:hypothetical protein
MHRMNDDERPFPIEEMPDAPLPNRLTRGTLMGCVGLAGVMALPLLLFLPFESWGLSRWANLLIQLLAFGALGGGIWLLARVPSTAGVRSNDPTHPLTARGAAPVLERPAAWPNRLGVATVWALLLLAFGGFALAAFDLGQPAAVPIGMAIVCLAGTLLAANGLGIALGRLKPPALRWVRTPATASWFPQGGSLLLVGLTLLGWALLIAAEASLVWGAIGLVVLLLAILLGAATFRQLPAPGHR